jgi:predicted Zn-dependent protease with MMP-like domain
VSRPASPRRRDRHGRGLRRPLLPRRAEVGALHVALPAARTPGDRFDELVHDARERLEQRWGRELEHVDWAVVDVPGLPRDLSALAADPDVVADETAGGAVPLGRLRPAGTDARGRARRPVVVVYRRPLEARAGSRAELGELVHDVVVDVVARLLGLDPDVVDPEDG